jgi:archaellum component FlaF (FlaF/FlaG flagellin family)
MNSNLYSKRMQVYAYTTATVILIGLLIGVGYLYKSDKVNNSDSVLMFILGQVLGAWVALTNKIYRITTIGAEKNAE